MVKHKYLGDIGEFGKAGESSRYFYLTKKDMGDVFYRSVFTHLQSLFTTCDYRIKREPDETETCLYVFSNSDEPTFSFLLPECLTQFSRLQIYLSYCCPYFLKEKYKWDETKGYMRNEI